jgi:hypothetical protein
VAQEPEYTALIDELVRFRDGLLEGGPSDRTLAEAAQASPTTIGNWLRRGQFPQEIDPLLRLVRAVQGWAENAGLTSRPEVAALLDEQQWRRAYRAEARRRADGIRGAVEAGQGRAVLERMRPGRPLSEVTDPFRLEVHRAIASTVTGLPALPTYVEREHDQKLAKVVAQAAAGKNRIAVLVGASSTGKTRTCWEALHQLRDLAEPWRLWHPIDPTRPDAILADLAALAPRTVVWLNEAQEYLAHDQLGEKVAAGLRTLLDDDPSRAPVLVLATLWPEHWNTLTSRSDPDRHAQARELLGGHEIRVPDAFTGADLAALTTGTAGHDPRLGEAAAHARDGQITQYLAGGLVLLDRYQSAPPTTRALIHAAMDARRLGAGPHIPWVWLAQAAPGYLTDTEWDTASDDWLERALGYLTTPWNGIPGILTPVKTTTARNQRRTTPDVGPTRHRTSQQGPLYRLADYLEQHGRRHRADTIPPIDFWTAAARHAHPADLITLGDAAHARGLYRDSAQLHKHATPHNARAARALVSHLHALHPTDHRPAQWAADHAPLSNSNAVTNLLYSLRGTGADEEALALLDRVAAHMSVDNRDGVTSLLYQMRDAGADKQAVVLLERAAARVPLDDPFAVNWLLHHWLWKAGAVEQTAALLDRVAARALDHPAAFAELLKWLRCTGADEQVAALLDRNPAARVPLNDPNAVTNLLDSLRKAGADGQVAVLLDRNPATWVSLDHPQAVCRLLDWLWQAGADEQATVLLDRAAVRMPLDHPQAVDILLDRLQKAGAVQQAAVLLDRVAARASLDDARAVGILLARLRTAGTDEQIAALLDRNPAARVPLNDPNAVALLLDRLWGVGADEQTAALLDRNPAARVTLDNPYAVVALLDSLRKTGADEQTAALLDRAAAHVSVDDSWAVCRLLDWLWEAGAVQQTAALLDRAAAHVSVNDSWVVCRLLDLLRKAGADEQTSVLSDRAIAQMSLDDPWAVGRLLNWLWEAGADEKAATLLDRAAAHSQSLNSLVHHLREAGAVQQATALLNRAIAHVSLDDPYAVDSLLDRLRRAGADKHFAALLEQNPAGRVCLDKTHAVAGLLDRLREVGADEQAAVLLDRAAARMSLNYPDTVVWLLDRLRRAGADKQIAALLDRNPAARVPLNDPNAVALLLDRLWKVGADEQAAVLLDRAAARMFLDDPRAVASLLDRLREVRADEKAAALLDQLPAAGCFDQWIRSGGDPMRFRLGREPDGSSAPPWAWDDLE